MAEESGRDAERAEVDVHDDQAEAVEEVVGAQRQVRHRLQDFQVCCQPASVPLFGVALCESWRGGQIVCFKTSSRNLISHKLIKHR